MMSDHCEENTAKPSDCENMLIPVQPNGVAVADTLPSDLSERECVLDGYSVFYISDMHLESKIVRRFQSEKYVTDNQVHEFIIEIVRELFSDELVKSITSYLPMAVIFCGDITGVFEIAKVFYGEFISKWSEIRKFDGRYHHVYAVLGNHEFWEFKTIQACFNSYKRLFDNLGICVLNNTMVPFGQITTSEDRDSYIRREAKAYPQKTQRQLERMYDNISRRRHTLWIVGGVGFAGYNETFNATQGIYRNALTHEEERGETEKWNKIYEQARLQAKSSNDMLLTVTHNPLSDWKKDGLPHHNCVYFSGHNHRQELFQDKENNSYIFADNQIGYHHDLPIKFKRAFIYKKTNPFASLMDGYHEISNHDYFRFCDYIGDAIRGTGNIDRLIQNHMAKFYMVKQVGFYGFFLISSTRAYLCAGGNTILMPKYYTIQEINEKFLPMVNNFKKILMPYRKAQEKISKSIKKFGGSGRIHGCIIDIDYFNHVLLNPQNGKTEFYYSPQYGCVELFDDLIDLLNSHNPTLAQNYFKQLSLGPDTLLQYKKDAEVKHEKGGEIIQVDIKHSVYSGSRQVNQIQRLFDKKVLRAWQESLLREETSSDGIGIVRRIE